MSEKTMTSAHVELEIAIDAPREEVWRSLIEDVATWWPREFYVTESPKFILEPKIGGHLYEDTGNGTGLIWFKVTGFMPPKQIILEGHIAPPFGGPCMSLCTLSLDEDGDSTTFRLNDHLCGVLPTTSQDALDSGWKQIFAKNFKEYVEKRVS